MSVGVGGNFKLRALGTLSGRLAHLEEGDGELSFSVAPEIDHMFLPLSYYKLSYHIYSLYYTFYIVATLCLLVTILFCLILIFLNATNLVVMYLV